MDAIRRFFRGGKKEGDSVTPSVILSDDALLGIIECISVPISDSDERGANPAQVVLAVQRVMRTLNEHPEEFAGRTLDSADVFQAMPRFGIDLSPEALAAWRDSQEQDL